MTLHHAPGAGSAPREPVPPSWWRLELLCPPELEESLFWKLPLLGIRRLALQHRPEAPEQRRLLAWLPACDWPESQRCELAASLAPLAEPFGLPFPELAWHHQREEDWNLSWKQHWQADPVGERLLVLPAWLEPPPEHADRLVIRMDPGSAFGTGSHPSTRLCLEALEALAARRGGSLTGLRVADLGCGTGVLGLAALRLGAACVLAVDTDAVAVQATAGNARLNGLDGRLTVARGSLVVLDKLLEARPADLLLCNILAPVIEALAPGFAQVLDPYGEGLLSGLLVAQAPRLQSALAMTGWTASLAARQERWGLMTLRARGDVA
ncbi:50S ribosomal protein L11 methyltransferase [Cyanobium sp. FGCU-6]|jgi:ribosomal protein L11 methyltransferase|nr:50S ribosomal protein L11 methyltransferase [Cyanobium sp. FGCU6]